MSTAAAIFSICPGQAAKERSPSGIAVSCAVLTWICSASARSSSTARHTLSTDAVAFTLASTNPSGFSSRSTLNVPAQSGPLK